MFYELAVKEIYLIVSDLDKCFALKLSFEMHKWISMAVKPFAIKDDLQIQPLEFQSIQKCVVWHFMCNEWQLPFSHFAKA